MDSFFLYLQQMVEVCPYFYRAHKHLILEEIYFVDKEGSRIGFLFQQLGRKDNLHWISITSSITTRCCWVVGSGVATYRGSDFYTDVMDIVPYPERCNIRFCD